MNIILNINISENNKYYTLVDGVLYSKNKETLVLYPLGNTAETVEIPNFVTKIEVNAFQKSTNIKNIVVPDSVTDIKNYAFASTFVSAGFTFCAS